MKILKMKFWEIYDVRRYPQYIFVFGDNDVKKGCGDQAVIRHEPNAMGIPTKKFPSNNAKSFYTDNEYDRNCKNIHNSVNDIIVEAMNGTYTGVVFPTDGLGTGLAQLPVKAPKTNKFLLQELIRLKKTLREL